MSAVDGRSLHAVAMIDLTVTSLLIYFKLKGRGDWGREGGKGGEREKGREEGGRERKGEGERERGRKGRREREREEHSNTVHIKSLTHRY